MTTPEPIITTQETHGWPWEWYPAGPRAAAKLAKECGWDVIMAFSRGYVPGPGESWVLRDMIGVWVDGYRHRAVAIWERNPEAEFTAKKLESGIKPGEIPSGMQWSISSTLIMIGSGASFPYASLTDFRDWISRKADVDAEWYLDIRSAALEKERAAKAKTKASPAKAKIKEHA